MATAKDIKATVRPRAGKGAARAVRREGRVPGVIYGGNEPPLSISLDDAELRRRTAESARAYALSQSWDAIMETLREHYLRLIADVSSPAPAPSEALIS